MSGLLPSPDGLQPLAILINFLIVCQRSSSCEIINIPQTNGYFPKFFLSNQFLQMIIIDGRS